MIRFLKDVGLIVALFLIDYIVIDEIVVDTSAIWGFIFLMMFFGLAFFLGWYVNDHVGSLRERWTRSSR